MHNLQFISFLATFLLNLGLPPWVIGSTCTIPILHKVSIILVFSRRRTSIAQVLESVHWQTGRGIRKFCRLEMNCARACRKFPLEQILIWFFAIWNLRKESWPVELGWAFNRSESIFNPTDSEISEISEIPAHFLKFFFECAHELFDSLWFSVDYDAMIRDGLSPPLLR